MYEVCGVWYNKRMWYETCRMRECETWNKRMWYENMWNEKKWCGDMWNENVV